MSSSFCVGGTGKAINGAVSLAIERKVSVAWALRCNSILQHKHGPLSKVDNYTCITWGLFPPLKRYDAVDISFANSIHTPICFSMQVYNLQLIMPTPPQTCWFPFAFRTAVGMHQPWNKGMGDFSLLKDWILTLLQLQFWSSNNQLFFFLHTIVVGNNRNFLVGMLYGW